MEKEYNEFLNLIHALKRTTHKFSATSLAPAEFMTLIAIQHISDCSKNATESAGVKVSDISRHMHTSKPDMSKKIRTLEEKELVTRLESKQDKRVTLIQITDKGRTVLSDSKARVDSFLTNVFARMGEDEVEEFIRLCSHMQSAMEDEISEMKKGKDKYEENL